MEQSNNFDQTKIALEQLLPDVISFESNIGTLLIGELAVTIIIVEQGCLLLTGLNLPTHSKADALQYLELNAILAMKQQGSICFDPDSEQLYLATPITPDKINSENLFSALEQYQETHNWVEATALLGQTLTEGTPLASSVTPQAFKV